MILLVPMERIELSRGCPHRILSPARLPVPPHRHSFDSIQNFNIDMIVFIRKIAVNYRAHRIIEISVRVSHAERLTQGRDKILFSRHDTGQNAGAVFYFYIEGLLNDPCLTFYEDALIGGEQGVCYEKHCKVIAACNSYALQFGQGEPALSSRLLRSQAPSSGLLPAFSR